MIDASQREPACYKALHAAPRQMVALTATAQPRAPQVPHGHAKLTQGRTTQGHFVLPEMAQQDRAQASALLRDGPDSIPGRRFPGQRFDSALASGAA